MTRRRCVIPGTTYLLTRRTTRRYFLLAPDARGEANRIFWYALAVAAERCGVEVHAACMMSSHLHVVLTDVEGRHPEFTQHFHRTLANALKVARAWPEEVFNRGGTSMVELVTPAAVINAIAYTIANPVAAFAVRYAREWPGPQTSPADVGNRTVNAERPPHWFRSRRSFPTSASLRISMPTVLDQHFGPERARALVAHRLRRLHHRAWNTARDRRLSFVGPRRLLRMRHTRRAKSYEPFGQRNPRFAAAGNVRAAISAIARFRAFDTAYTRALTAWREGDRTVVFPCGTWSMRVHHGAACHAPP